MSMPDPYPTRREGDEPIPPALRVVDEPVPDRCESCQIGRPAFVAYWEETPTGAPAAFVVGAHCAQVARKRGAVLFPIESGEAQALLSLYWWKRWAA